MYGRRVKFFVVFSVAALLICVLRLMQMQVLPGSSVHEDVARLKQQRGSSQQLKTVRGKILDRRGRVLAVDEARFNLCVSYELSRYLDERVRQAKLLKARQDTSVHSSSSEADKEVQQRLEDLEHIIAKCTRFGMTQRDVRDRIQAINDRIWNLRSFIAWVRNGADPDIVEKHNNNLNSVPLSEAIEDFRRKVPDDADRMSLITQVDDIAGMREDQSLLELETDADVFAAQVEFLDVDGVTIVPKAHRHYPFGSAAAQTIGWIGPATGHYRELFADDRLSSYLKDDVCGKRPGMEYVCEAVLRGRRGELVRDIDRQVIRQSDRQFGQDVTLTIDIALQQRIEDYLQGYDHDPNCGPGMAAVVMDVVRADILALVSIPVFDLNRIRAHYNRFADDPNEPLRNRAINKQYPPGSVVKPLILIAGLEAGRIRPRDIISCPAQEAPRGWPNCWIYNTNQIGHDNVWANHARNAVKGSCNIYFSRLADRIEPVVLQKWLFRFGYGQPLDFASCSVQNSSETSSTRQSVTRRLHQAPGQISTVPVPAYTMIRSLEQIPPLARAERRYFGIGQGNLRATPLQVANAIAAIARGGTYKPPRLLLRKGNHSVGTPDTDGVPLGISPQTLEVTCDGMHAVVNEIGGTAYKAFASALAGFAQQGVTVHGKTGSTEQPDVAWFAGFVEDARGRSIAIAVVVEGGQSGPRDGAPLGRDIIRLCIEAGYVGTV
jgi:penicillin-binding protein 2